MLTIGFHGAMADKTKSDQLIEPRALKFVLSPLSRSPTENSINLIEGPH
jgi:hypothetical protein